ncbi:hypothetical protein DFP72DRAFT_1102402 [Ephemerocybe angulata]|uniref:3'-5' exonuclease n=1 Tax=Ephemerocybe angulata TaxID=980116 RepID=A0A8H6I786_9AGAR|nr:hypothetical protein DFP72DRAFT_1102402 [Tulosesus angulatus]
MPLALTLAICHLKTILRSYVGDSARLASTAPPTPSTSSETESPLASASPELADALESSAIGSLLGKRKRGRPRTKEVVEGPKRPRGRPRKLVVVADTTPPPAKRRGRPPKVETGSKGRVEVRITSGPITIPATGHHLHHPRLHPLAPVFPTVQSRPLARPNNPHNTTLERTTASIAERPSNAAEHTFNVGTPLETSNQPITADDKDDDASGDGIGEETGGRDEGDENDDEHEQVGEARPEASQPSTPRIRKPLPNWLMDDFRTCLETLQRRDVNGQFDLYAKERTFWFRREGTWFSLQTSNLSPPRLYAPRFFVWDPLALYNQLPCPTCRKALTRHSAMSQPRRCVDLTSTFWIVGFRYRCRHCLHPKTGKRTVTWRSWDSRVLAGLPRSLAAHFPARLTHRSAVSNELFSWMRSCFQNGMGSKQFADAVLCQHLLAYDQLQLQYLEHLSQCADISRMMGQMYKPFLPFEDSSSDGFHGFVPSAIYFRDIYDSFMEEHRHYYEQHTAMLSADICSIDHSHKLPKQVANVNGKRAFNAALCFANQRGEIRSFSLVPTKAQSQYELALSKIRDSLQLYGHPPVQLIYTDNITDRAFLETSFPSLRVGVTPVEKYGHLPAFTLPPGVTTLVRGEESAINVALSTILEHVPIGEDEDEVVVGFDCEWNVEGLGHGRVEQGDIAIVQLAFEDRVYILQISKMVGHSHLPEKLIMLLQNPSVRKAGRAVNSDLKHLEEIVQPATPFTGALDLAAYAKERHVVSNARCSLADLCATVLGKSLRKNVSERFSMDWERAHLTSEQMEYAACDAYAPLAIYRELSKLRVPQPLPQILPQSGADILVYGQDRSSPIASGHLSPLPFPIEYDGIHITPTRALVTITKVLVPGAIITSHHKRPLSAFGSTPFELVCNRTYLRMYDPLTFELPCPPTPMSQSEDEPGGTNEENAGGVEPEEPLGRSDRPGEELESRAGELLQRALGLSGSLDDDEEDLDELSPLAAEPAGGARVVDAGSDAQGRIMSANIKRPSGQTGNILRTRVLKDIFHLFNMLRLPATHGLRKEFTRALRDILFVANLEDRVRIMAWASRQPGAPTFEQLAIRHAHWLWQRCRRYIPLPEVIFPMVEKLFRTYGPLQDMTTHEPLFRPQHWKTAAQILDLIRLGYVSDPPNIPLYTKIGVDAKAGNLPIYRCSRGTNFTEGIHSQLRSRLPTVGVSIRHINARIPEYVYVHNKRVGTMNSTGKKYRGHYDLWISNRIQEREAFLEGVLSGPLSIPSTSNGDLYIQTKERLGILMIPDNIRSEAGIAEHAPDSAIHAPRRDFEYLARVQNTRKAVLPVHTTEEYDLFDDLMKSSSAFNSRSRGPRLETCSQGVE